MDRRRFLMLGGASAAALAVGGALLLNADAPWARNRLSVKASEMCAALATAFLDGSLPADATAKTQAVQAFLGRLEVAVAALPSHAQAELAQLLAIMVTSVGRQLLVGLSSPWADATVADMQAALQGMRSSRISLRQQAYMALHDLVGAAYFSDSTTWTVLGYPGPVDL